MSYYPDVNSKINLSVFVMLNSTRLEKLACNHEHILVAAVPKSGGSWLSETLGQFPNQSRVDLLPDFDYREQEFAFERLLAYHSINYTAHQHVKYSTTTAAYIDIFSIKPVVLVRNLFDCVLSMKDWLDIGDGNSRRWSMANIPNEYYRWSDGEKFDFIIDMMMPWYVLFVASWQDCSNCVWVKYADLLADPVTVLTRLSDELKLGVGKDAIESALQKSASLPTKKNVCQVGRGEMLTPAQKDRIRKFASYYPTRDFSAVGL